MLFSTLNGRRAAALRLVGLAAVLYTIFASEKHAPALSGRGLVVLILTVIGALAWLAWTFWSSQDRTKGMTADQFLLAACGGLLAAACPNSGASALGFAASVSAGARAGLPRSLSVAFIAALGFAIGALIYGGNGVGVIAYALGFAASALGGSNILQVRQRAEQAELLLAQTQRSHEEQLRAEQLEQQTRLARDIHDVLAHSLAGLTIQLEATSALLDAGASTQQIRERLTRAHELAREGLTETRRAVAALRGVPAAERATAGTTEIDDQLAALAAGYQDADGHTADYTLHGDAAQLTGQVGDTVLRAVQEAITNVRKHAPGARLSVHVSVEPQGVEVRIANRGGSAARPELASTGGGYGLLGMRERAELTGGTLAAGPTDDGWTVELRLPGVPSGDLTAYDASA